MKTGRKRLGQPVSITLTDEQRAWIDSFCQAGETRCQIVRWIIQEAMDKEKAESNQQAAI